MILPKFTDNIQWDYSYKGKRLGLKSPFITRPNDKTIPQSPEHMVRFIFKTFYVPT